MTRRTRLVLGVIGAATIGVLLLLGCRGLPEFGSGFHPYRDRAVAAAIQHVTANVVSAVNFDQRGIDTLGEETILLAATLGATVLLRPTRREAGHPQPRFGDDSRPPRRPPVVLPLTRVTGYLLVPVSLLVGIDVVTHGAISPGGGFQGGVVAATGVHLLFVAGDYPALEKARPVPIAEWSDALGALAFLAIALVGLAVGGVLLMNVLPLGSFGDLASSGTVVALSAAVGVEVTGGVVVLLGRFLQQAFAVGTG